jgi:hypothetical protein
MPQPDLPGSAPDPLASPPVVPLLPIFPRRRGRRRPLPDSFAVHRIPLPAPAPPYDGGDRRADPLPPSSGLPGAGLRSAGLRDAAPGWPADGSRPADGSPWPSQFAQVLAETLAGSRAPRQLTSWTTEQARRRIRQLGPTLRAQQRPLVRRVLTSEPEPGVVEMTVIVAVGSRTRALAVRLERAGGQQEWLCTAIEAA